MGRFLKKIKNKQYGQAMAEFALTIPIFLLLVFGIIEVSRFFLVYSSVFTASREASRFGSSVGEIKDLPNYMNCSEIALRAQDMGFFGGVNADEVIVYYEQTPGTKIGDCGSYEPVLGDRVVVEVSANYKPLLIDFVLPDGIVVSSVNGRTIMKEIAMVVTPIVPPNCGNAMNDIVMSVPTKLDNKTLVIDIENKSKSITYQLVNIVGINWDNNSDKRNLNEVSWGAIGDKIWIGPTAPPVTIEEDAVEIYETRNLPKGQTQRLFLNFTQNANNTDLSFVITFRILGWEYDECPLNYDEE